MQQVIRVYYDNPKWHERDTIDRVNELLEEGWEVIFMQTFSGYSKTEDGSYGVTFVLDDSKKTQKEAEIKKQEQQYNQNETQNNNQNIEQIAVENVEIKQDENMQNNYMGY